CCPRQFVQRGLLLNAPVWISTILTLSRLTKHSPLWCWRGRKNSDQIWPERINTAGPSHWVTRLERQGHGWCRRCCTLWQTPGVVMDSKPCAKVVGKLT